MKLSPCETRTSLDLTELERIGMLAIGRALKADLCIGRFAFYQYPSCAGMMEW